MEPWYRVVTLRKEVREGRSFSPDEFTIALKQVVADTASEDEKLIQEGAAEYLWSLFTQRLRQP